MAHFIPYRSAAAGVVRVEQSGFNVDISINGEGQGMGVYFTTPSYIEEDDFSITDITIPDGTAAYQRDVHFNDYTPLGRKQWSLRVFYSPGTTEGTTTYHLKIKNETYDVSSVFTLQSD